MKKQILLLFLAAALVSLCAAAAVHAQIQILYPTQVTSTIRTETYSNGDSYNGEFVNGKFNGIGVYTWANGDSYSGQFVDGQIDGYGKMSFANGRSWSGLFSKGTINSGSGAFYVGTAGDMFEGKWENGQPTGQGTLIHSSGWSEPGTYVNGQFVSTSYPPGSVSPNAGYGENPFRGLTVGSTVYFGRFEQDNNYSNGSEAIQWRVLDIRNGRALLLSVYGLDTMYYNYAAQAITWENSTVRSYLNGNFYNSAFTAQERQYIAQSYIYNNNSAKYGTYGGNPTNDFVFLLSQDEVRSYFPSESQRKMQPTAVARAHGAYGTADKNCAWWWLRSPGQATNCASSINSIGVLLDTGPVVTDRTGVIRPAMWVNIG